MRFEHWFYTVPLRIRSLFRRRSKSSAARSAGSTTLRTSFRICAMASGKSAAAQALLCWRLYAWWSVSAPRPLFLAGSKESCFVRFPAWCTRKGWSPSPGPNLQETATPISHGPIGSIFRRAAP
jgi:hypothetical protein